MIGKYDLTDIVFAANDCTSKDRAFIAALVIASTTSDDVPYDHKRGLVHFLLRHDPHDPTKNKEIQ